MFIIGVPDGTGIYSREDDACEGLENVSGQRQQLSASHTLCRWRRLLPERFSHVPCQVSGRLVVKE